MNLTGEFTIHKSDYGYYTNLSTKNKEGKYEYMAIAVQFLDKDYNVDDFTKVNVEESFLSWFPSKDGTKKVKMLIKKCNKVEKTSGSLTHDDSDLPF